MKKIFALLLTAVLLAGVLSVTAFARGGCCRSGYEACTVESCEQYGLHEHDGVWHRTAYELCAAEGCYRYSPHAEGEGCYYYGEGAGRGCGRRAGSR